MIRNYLKTAFRNLVRNRVYAIINITGFAIGLAVSILIIFYVKHELTYDRFHVKKDSIYRLAFEQSDGNDNSTEPHSVPIMGPELHQEFPEVKNFARLSTYHGGILTTANQGFRESKIRYADSSFFRMFSFPLLKGNPKTALAGPNKIVLTRELAAKLFPGMDALGKTLTYNNQNTLTVSGIMKDLPVKNHIKFSALISFETAYNNFFKGHFGWNGGWSYYTYLLMNEKKSASTFEPKLDDFIYEKIGKKYEAGGWSIDPFLEPLADIYLHHESMDDPESTGDLTNIYIFGVVALFILLIAGINFTNLSTAQAMKRFKEVGIRKVAGASRKRLIGQFIGESVMVTLISFILAIILIEVFLPHFNRLIGKEISIYHFSNLDVLLGIPVLVIVVGILSGSYPAFFLSAYRVHSILKGSSSPGKKRFSLSNTLTITQFVISIALIICSLVIYNQLHYMQNKKLGYNKENLLSLSLESTQTIEKDMLLKKELLKIPGIEDVSIASDYPGMGVSSNGYLPEGYEEPRILNVIHVDPDYLETIGLEIIQGRDFMKNSQTDRQAYLINESLAKALNWKNPIGKYIERNGKHPVIGVVKDFHFAPLHEEIKPLIFTQQDPWGGEKALIRMNKGEAREILSGIRNTWEELFGGEPFHYEFVDNTFKKTYQVDIRFGEIILSFAILAIVIACLGLFGLTAFFTEQRTKEIGIRKTMGATTGKINNLIIKQYTRWVLLANLVAWPVAWYAMNSWLQNYAYRIELTIPFFLTGALIALFISILTVSYQSMRAANVDPAKSLRYE
jgi:putative ABC transport system permease protein